VECFFYIFYRYVLNPSLSVPLQLVVLSLAIHSYSPDPTCVLTSEPTTIISGNGDVQYATRHFVSVAIWTDISLQHAGSTDIIRIMLQGPPSH